MSLKPCHVTRACPAHTSATACEKLVKISVKFGVAKKIQNIVILRYSIVFLEFVDSKDARGAVLAYLSNTSVNIRYVVGHFV